MPIARCLALSHAVGSGAAWLMGLVREVEGLEHVFFIMPGRDGRGRVAELVFCEGGSGTGPFGELRQVCSG